MWEPITSLRVRGSYSESFRPPGLLDLDESTNYFAYLPVKDPTTNSFSNVLVWGGKSKDLKQENARSWTTGLEDFSPRISRGTAIALTYFHTEFVDRLSQPTPTADLLSNPEFADLITRNPSAEYRSAVCDRAPLAGSLGDCRAMPIAAIADMRFRNDAVVRTQGFDLLSKYSVEAHRSASSRSI